MINHKNKTIIIHIPKTGGSSIKKNIDGFTYNGYHKTGDVQKRLAGNLWNEYFKFTIVRNPWDWVYSIYSFYKMGSKITLFDSSRIPNTFKEFVSDLDKNLNIIGLNFNQCDFIGDELDYVGRFENLTEEYNIIRQKIGLEKKSFSHERKSIRKNDYHDIYDEEMIEIIRKKYDKDIKKYNYEY